jgi:hypothetical protein
VKHRSQLLIIGIVLAVLAASCGPATEVPTDVEATDVPASTNTPEPTEEPTEEPTPTTAPTEEPTEEPTATTAPTEGPTEEPTPTVAPTEETAPEIDLSDPVLQEQLLAFQTMVFINFNGSGIMFTASQASSSQTLAQAMDTIFNEAFAATDRAMAEIEPAEELEPAWQQAQATHEQIRSLTNQAVAGQITLDELVTQLQGLDTSYGQTTMNYLMEAYGFTEAELLEYANTAQTTILETFGE